MGSIWKHPKTGIYQFGGIEWINGQPRRVQKSLGTRDLKEGLKKQLDIEKTLLQQKGPKRGVRTLKGGIDWFLGREKQDVRNGLKSPRTVKDYQYSLNKFYRFVEQRYGNIPLKDIKRSHWNSFQTSIRDLSPTTQINLKTHIRRFFDSDEVQRVTKGNGNPIPKKLGKLQRNQRTIDQVPVGSDWIGLTKRLYEKSELNDIPFKLLYCLTQTGCRIGELKRLKWTETLDEEHQTTGGSIPFSILSEEDTHIRIRSKGKYREIKVNSKVREQFNMIRSIDHSNTYVFGNPDTDSEYNHHVFTKRLRTCVLELDQSPRITPHGLRHGWITHMINTLGPTKMSHIGDYVGQSTIWITEHYRHKDEDQINEVLGID